MKPGILLALPCYSESTAPMHAMRVYREYTQHRSAEEMPYQLAYKPTRCSLLANGFNQALAHASQMRDAGLIRYFAMCHADIVPEPGFMDKLFGLIRETQADVVSVVVPIKNAPLDKGDVATGPDGRMYRMMVQATAEGDPSEATSTAIDGEDQWRPARRLSLTDLRNAPETFSGEDIGAPGRLLVNTGLWIADLFGEWATRIKEVNGVETLACAFSINDQIAVRRNDDGSAEYAAQVEPEDWRFSRYLNSIRAKVLATTAVSVNHLGTLGYTNTKPAPTRILQETNS